MAWISPRSPRLPKMIKLTALQPQFEPEATPRSTEWREIGQHRPWQTVVPFHK
jgi:hypothetical protein